LDFVEAGTTIALGQKSNMPREIIKLWQSSTFWQSHTLIFSIFVIQKRFGLFCQILTRSRPVRVGFSLKVSWLIWKWKRTLPWNCFWNLSLIF
jgi:hypothetical protein